MRVFLIVLLSLGLCLPLQAQEGPEERVYKVRILTSPEPAEVFLDVSGRRRYEKYLGLSTDPILIDLGTLEGASGFHLIVRRDGYFDKRERIGAGYFLSRDTFPEQGRIRLEPLNWWIPVREFALRHRWLLALTLLLGSSAFGLFLKRRRRLVTRVKKLEAYAGTEAKKDPLLGSILERWRLVEFLGQGGSARVYRAIPDDTLKESDSVAIKIFTPETSATFDFQERFQREAEIYGKLQHPGIVALIDWGRWDDLFFLVMEYVEGTPLSEIRRAEDSDLETRVSYLVQLAEALAHAHNVGVIHRDVKPENLMLTQGDRIKLMDFGLARDILSSFTKTGRAMGTPAYMAPEQIEGKFLDHRCDQYSLGAVAYELLCGEKPFSTDESDAAPILFQQVHHDPVPLREKAPEVPEALEAVVKKLMSRKPEDRYPNMSRVVEALKGVLL